MAHVSLIGNLRQYTGGVTELDVEAANVRQLFARLGEKYPELLPHLETGSAVAIDGQIYQDALFQPIGPDSDVHILPQIAGGMRRTAAVAAEAPGVRQRSSTAMPSPCLAHRCDCLRTVLRAFSRGNGALDNPTVMIGALRRSTHRLYEWPSAAADAGRVLLGGQHGRRPARHRPDLAVPCSSFLRWVVVMAVLWPIYGGQVREHWPQIRPRSYPERPARPTACCQRPSGSM